MTPQAAGDDRDNSASRIRYRRDAEIHPRPTVAMSDGTLRGYVAEGRAARLPAGTAVEYRSNRPDVVRAESGGLRTGEPGTATVTATFRQGTSVLTEEFVVHVR